MLRYIRILFIAGTALVLISLALANRAPVELRLVPSEAGNLLGLGHAWQLPLFVVIFLAVALGVLIGFVWEWLREMRLRSAAKHQGRTVARLERELEVLRDSRSAPPKDEVLAILEEGERK